MQPDASKIVVLGTGGTIAGTAADATDNVGYSAATLGVDRLIAAVPALARFDLDAEQVAQIDSKDMDHAVWQRLAVCCRLHLARSEVAGIVVTHGTDTLEETAWFLQRTLAPAKPIVLTAAMRPATSLLADGPQNLLDAVTVAAHDGARGVLAVLAGKVHAARDVRKTHTYALDAFGSGDGGPVGRVEEGVATLSRRFDAESTALDAVLDIAPGNWPQVEIVWSHAGVGRRGVDLWVQAGVDGLVVAGTGNGTLHCALVDALTAAQDAGVRIWRASRCGDGRVLPSPDDRFPGTGALTPVKARIEMLLQLAAEGRRAAAPADGSPVTPPSD